MSHEHLIFIFRNDGKTHRHSSCRNFINAPVHWAAEVLCPGAFGSFDQLVCELAATRQASET